jgi:hypothetical protein
MVFFFLFFERSPKIFWHASTSRDTLRTKNDAKNVRYVTKPYTICDGKWKVFGSQREKLDLIFGSAYALVEDVAIHG